MIVIRSTHGNDGESSQEFKCYLTIGREVLIWNLKTRIADLVQNARIR